MIMISLYIISADKVFLAWILDFYVVVNSSFQLKCSFYLLEVSISYEEKKPRIILEGSIQRILLHWQIVDLSLIELPAQ